MGNSMDDIWVSFSDPKQELSIKKFLSYAPKSLNSFERQVLKTLNELYRYNEEHSLFKTFPKREKPLLIDCNYTQIKHGWVGSYSGKQNRIVLCNDLTEEDLKLALIHELKHAEQYFDDSSYNNYQRHQVYCVYEVLAKLFVGQFLGRGAYFAISLPQALDKWLDKHYYPNYKEKYDKQWPIGTNDRGVSKLPESFGLDDKTEKEIIIILNKKILKNPPKIS